MIYLASPYTHEDPAVREHRFQLVCKHAAAMMRQGMHVYSPIAAHHPMAMYGLPINWEYWKAIDTEMVTLCSGFTVLMLAGWEDSVGVQAEIEIAESLGRIIVYDDPELVFATDANQA